MTDGKVSVYVDDNTTISGEVYFKSLVVFLRLQGMGYGEMMEIISNAWAADFKKKGYPLDGILIGYPLGAAVPQTQATYRKRWGNDENK
jgi:hypothetical protein